MTPRAGLLAVLDHAADGPRRLEHAIGSVLGAGLMLALDSADVGQDTT